MEIKLNRYAELTASKLPKGLSSFHFSLVLIFGLTLAFSILVSPYHIEGDQVHYNRAYAELKGLSLADAFNSYQAIIFTAEPIHLMIVWLTSSLGFDKNMVMGFSNALLSCLFALYLRRKGAGIVMVFWLTFSAYYLHTMFFTLERAKFAFIFMLLSLITERKWLLLLAVFTHSMMLIPLILNKIGQKLFGVSSKLSVTPLNLSRRKIIPVLFSLALLIIVVDGLGIHIFDKFFLYVNDDLNNDRFGWWPLVPLCGLTLLTGSKNKKIVTFFFICLIVLAALVGSSRINLFGYFGFLYYSNFSSQFFRWGSAILGAYFIYKSWGYITNIYYYGG